uniref:ionotropic receptor 144 precursor n=1 Tax=Aedes aegypti TaxID=7159 RepID=UPI000C210161|nr:ionotropic receptor 144 precursor [Aedes aegypti]
MQYNIKLILLLSSFTHVSTELWLQQQLLQYTVSVIQHYARQKPGWFECIFYDISAGTDYGWFNALLSSPHLDNVARYVIDENFRIDYGIIPLKPSLTVVYVGDRELHPSASPLLVQLFFAFLDANCRLIVLLNTENFKVYQGIGSLLAYAQFDKITFVGTRIMRTIQMGLFGMAGRVTAWFPHPKDLIRSSIRNAHARQIGFTHFIQPWYPAQVWLLQTADYLNSSLKYYPNVCAGVKSQPECVERLFKAGHIDIALEHRDASEYMASQYRMLFCVIPISRMILVPQGRPYNAIEMFTKPFTWETWTVLLLTLLLIETLSYIFPTLYKNDPILLLVCGFERYNLHYASIKEKVTLLPMMIFFFLMFNAYGTKMIAFMTDKPSVGNIKTLNELAKSDLKIMTDLELDKRLKNDSLLGPLMVHKPISSDNLQLDGEHAHLSTNLEAAFLVSLRRNYDFKLHRPKYVIINEIKSTSVVTYWIGMKTPFAEAFYYTQKVFFEAGLFHWWQNELMDMIAARDRTDHTAVDVEGSGMLTFDDLTSTWAVFAIGLCVSLVVLGLEFVVKYFNK